MKEAFETAFSESVSFWKAHLYSLIVRRLFESPILPVCLSIVHFSILPLLESLNLFIVDFERIPEVLSLSAWPDGQTCGLHDEVQHFDPVESPSDRLENVHVPSPGAFAEWFSCVL